jgi:hypothetical protein
VVVLIMERQTLCLNGEVRWGKFGDCLGKLRVERVAAQSADNDRDAKLAHDVGS